MERDRKRERERDRQTETDRESEMTNIDPVLLIKQHVRKAWCSVYDLFVELTDVMDMRLLVSWSVLT